MRPGGLPGPHRAARVQVTSGEQRDLIEGSRLVGTTLDSPTVERLGRFIGLLAIWNQRLRLTGERDRAVLVRKHVVDSLALVPELPSSGVVADIGSGGGFPGIVLGCARPDLPLRLIEPRRRPASFLSEAIRTVPLPRAQVLEVRGEEAAKDLGRRCAAIVSRALRLDLLLSIASPLLAPSGIAIAMQTPALSDTKAREIARAAGLKLFRSKDYRLAAGESRRLLVFRFSSGGPLSPED